MVIVQELSWFILQRYCIILFLKYCNTITKEKIKYLSMLFKIQNHFTRKLFVFLYRLKDFSLNSVFQHGKILFCHSFDLNVFRIYYFISIFTFCRNMPKTDKVRNSFENSTNLLIKIKQQMGELYLVLNVMLNISMLLLSRE